MDTATKILLAKLHLGEAQTESLADWAVSMLELGYKTDHLGVLAGLALECSPNPVEVRHYFALVLDEFGWSMPPMQQMLREYGAATAEEIVSGAVSPVVGCRRMYQLYLKLVYCDCGDNDNHPDLTDWLYLDEQLDRRTYEELSGERLDAAIIEAAHSYLSARESSHGEWKED